MGYYRQYLKGFANGAKHQFIAKGASWYWDEQTHKTFMDLKKGLAIAPVLEHPDSSQTYILDTDTGGMAVGAVL